MAENTVENTITEKYLVFSIREKRYALPSKIINEVTALEKVFPLPLVPEYVLGIINRYSVPYALIDLSFLLLKNTSGARKVIVLKEEVDKLALLIDDVIDIADLPPEKLMEVEQEEAALSGLVSAFFEWKEHPVFCIEIGELISQIKQDFVQQEA
ncbi:MAG: chemotaxis protein CheW [Treponema sp.]|nr:chemotaxis protein CheW [Treponema sp.]